MKPKYLIVWSLTPQNGQTLEQFVSNSRSKRNKKNPEHSFVDIGK